MKTTTATQSLWLEAMPASGYPPLQGDHRCDIAVLCGGISGLTTALLCKQEGARVAVLEANRAGGGVTGNNTAKVSALQSTMYSTIRSQHGTAAAADYAAGSAAAVEKVAALAAEGIDCELQRRAAYTYATSSSELRSVEEEAHASHEAGLPTVLTDTVDLPLPVTGAVRLDDQIEFHPVRYAQGLAAAIEGDGSRVFEGTRALALHEGRPSRVDTPSGTVSADRVVVATHYPLFDRGFYFARLEAERSYCIAARLRGEPSRGLSINAASPKWSVRSYGDLLILCGQGHPTGARGVGNERYRRLEDFARKHWDVEEITHRWSAQDPSPYDKLPMIGPYTPGSSRLFVVAGFMKWGLSGGTLGAMILSDLLAGRTNPWAARFSPNRLSPRSAPTFARMNAKVGVDLIGDRFTPAQATSTDEVPPGQARIIRDGAGKTGVYRDEAGALHAVSLRCTHLGCLLRFNGAERSWDCPCHGSRFDVDGAVLEGPAVHPLERKSF
ncbi:MAG: FAD-dependent oxidoreductase [Actinomycetota bacterium]|nr:FAD-dependent oxidoreductase [Actinomycetota bacterium]